MPAPSLLLPSLVLGGSSLLGSLIGGNATAKAQAAANATNQRIADQANAFNRSQYLLSRGVSDSTLGVPGGYVNTQLPLWATIGGQPAEQSLFNSIIATGLGGAINTNDPNSFASINQVKEYLAANPEDAAGIQAMLTETGDARDPAQWLHDHVLASATNEGGENNFTPKLKAFAEKTNAANGNASAIPTEWQSLLDASRNAVGNIYNGQYLDSELSALAPALEARLRLGDLAMQRNTELRDKTKSIYDADLLRADTYSQAAMEAVNRAMAEQGAKRALQGYSGGSSMDDLTRARTLATGYQQGAGARAQAGVDYATRLASILDADAAQVGENARVQNALDRLSLITSDNNRRIGNVGTAGSLYSQQVSLENLANDQKFRDLDATLKRLGSLNTGGAVQPASYVAPQVSPVLTSGQIAGSAISSLAGMGMDYFSNQALIKALNGSSAMKGGLMSTTPASGSVLGVV